MDMSYYKQYEPVFGKWTIARELGSGSYGKVFELEHVDSYDGEVMKAALKVITVPMNQSEIDTLRDNGMDEESVTAYLRSNVDDFKSEIKLMSKLKGESTIVSYEDHKVVPHKDAIGWDILIQMELLTPLMKFISANGGELSRDEVIKLGIDICKALELCRKYNIVHRDIKPENIFVSPSGRYKLGDFGVAKTVEKTVGGLSKKGTYTYMAPEVYKGEEYGASVDIYSLGIVLYRYLNNGRAPFLPQPPEVITYNSNSEAVMRRINGEELPAPVKADENLCAIVLKACAYNPKDRYASATQMREDLEAVAEGKAPVYAVSKWDETLSMPKPMPKAEPKPAPKPTPKPKTDTVSMPKAEIEPDAGFIPPVKAAPKAAPKRKRKGALVAGAALLLAIGVGFAAFAMKDSSPAPSPKETDTHLAAPTATVAPTATDAPTATVAPTAEPIQADWTKWSKQLPKDVNEEQFEIEKKEFYRSRSKETKTTTSSKTPSGWTLEKTVDSGEFGAWSGWSTTPVSANANRKVEKETRYRSKTLETTTSSSPSKSGWTLTDTTYSWSDYGAWSDWSTSAVSSSDSTKVESKTQYSYSVKETTTSSSPSLSGWTQYDSSVSYGSWSNWSDSAVSANSTTEVETRQVQATPAVTKYRYGRYTDGSHAHFSDKLGKSTYGGNWYLQYSGWYSSRQTPTDTDWGYSTQNNSAGTGRWNSSRQRYVWDRYKVGGKAYYWEQSQTTAATYKTQYRYRSKSTTYYFYKWSDWSAYSDTYQASSSTKSVRTRTLYRYAERSKIPTYHYERWTAWSNWTTQPISASSTKQVESKTFYRHKDKSSKKTYVYSRWGEWSEWSEAPAYKTDTVQVETQTMYRYKSK